MLAAIGYGIVHDQFTARLCAEYFTLAHPVVVRTESPTVLGLVWGVLATWWVGLCLGVLPAAASRLGRRPKLPVQRLIGPVLRLMAIMAVAAVLAASVGWILGAAEIIQLHGRLAAEIPAVRHARFFSAAFAHSTSYSIGVVGGVFTCLSIYRRRAINAPDPGSTADRR